MDLKNGATSMTQGGPRGEDLKIAFWFGQASPATAQGSDDILVAALSGKGQLFAKGLWLRYDPSSIPNRQLLIWRV
jgi:hypothetical protein